MFNELITGVQWQSFPIKLIDQKIDCRALDWNCIRLWIDKRGLKWQDNKRLQIAAAL